VATTPKDLYAVLGVKKGASADEIKQAYRKLAREHHPDRNPGDDAAEERFKEIQTAYDVLSDPEKRKQYDAFGSSDGRRGFDPRGGGFDDFNLGDFGDLGDLFGGIFGRGAGRRRSQAQRGADLEAQVNLSFEDSLKGVETKIPVDVETACSDCGGSGAKPGTSPKVCPECRGRGVTSESQGLFALSQPCPRCRGNGTVIEDPCPSCRGTGRERRTKRYTVKIPAGVKDGTRIKLKGKGEAGSGGGPAGDLHVVTRVAESPIYQRRGADLVVEVPVGLADAALGTEVEVPTPDGAVSLKVPAGSEHGKLLRIKGRGAPRLKGGKGDVLARLKLEVPKKLNKKQRELWEQLRKVSRWRIGDLARVVPSVCRSSRFRGSVGRPRRLSSSLRPGGGYRWPTGTAPGRVSVRWPLVLAWWSGNGCWSPSGSYSLPAGHGWLFANSMALLWRSLRGSWLTRLCCSPELPSTPASIRRSMGRGYRGSHWPSRLSPARTWPTGLPRPTPHSDGRPEVQDDRDHGRLFPSDVGSGPGDPVRRRGRAAVGHGHARGGQRDPPGRVRHREPCPHLPRFGVRKAS
jgi:molecular chaperone DnaJ